jgi:hypothetical protein
LGKGALRAVPTNAESCRISGAMVGTLSMEFSGRDSGLRRDDHENTEN